MSRTYIRFSGEAPNLTFMDVERDGTSIQYGHWERVGEYAFLVLPEVAPSKHVQGLLEEALDAMPNTPTAKLIRAKARVMGIELRPPA